MLPAHFNSIYGNGVLGLNLIRADNRSATATGGPLRSVTVFCSHRICLSGQNLRVYRPWSAVYWGADSGPGVGSTGKYPLRLCGGSEPAQLTARHSDVLGSDKHAAVSGRIWVRCSQRRRHHRLWAIRLHCRRPIVTKTTTSRNDCHRLRALCLVLRANRHDPLFLWQRPPTMVATGNVGKFLASRRGRSALVWGGGFRAARDAPLLRGLAVAIVGRDSVTRWQPRRHACL